MIDLLDGIAIMSKQCSYQMGRPRQRKPRDVMRNRMGVAPLPQLGHWPRWCNCGRGFGNERELELRESQGVLKYHLGDL
jgi:hypothetical protein